MNLFGDHLGPKASAFLTDLVELCRRHRVSLSTSAYDGLQVWDLGGSGEEIWCNGVEDKTKEAPK